MKFERGRREFIKKTGLGLVALSIPSCASQLRSTLRNQQVAPVSSAPLEFKLTGECPIGAGRLLLPSFHSPKLSLGKSFSEQGNLFVTVDFQKKTLIAIQTPLTFSHSVLMMPGAEERALLLEKDGPIACVVNLRTQQVELIVRAKDAWNFNGHGVFSRDGKYFYDTEYNQVDKDLSAIVVRDAKTLEIISELQSGGVQPHDLKFFSGGEKMAVAHYGLLPGETERDLKASVTFLAMPSGKVIETVAAPGGNQELCHIAVTEAGKYIVSIQDFLRIPASDTNSLHMSKLQFRQNHRSAPILMGTVGGEQKVLWPEELKDKFVFNFSIAVDEARGIAGISHIRGNYVSFWDMNKMKFIKGHSLPDGVSGMELTKDKKYFIASSAKSMFFYSADSMEHLSTIDYGFPVAAPHSLFLAG